MSQSEVRERVARAAAVAEEEGPSRALELLAQIDPAEVTTYYPYWVIRAHLLRDTNRYSEAVEAFERALGLVEDRAVRRHLLDCLTEISRW
jgi:RNA polymerase sigma-70 factor, ECF subfamily